MRRCLPEILLMLPVLLGGCDALTCHTPADGPLPMGRWAGEGWSLTVQPDGTAFVESACARGAVNEPILLDDGGFAFTVMLTPQNVSPVAEPYETVFVGEICGETMSGEVSANSSSGVFELILGDPTQLQRCEATSAPLPQPGRR